MLKKPKKKNGDLHVYIPKGSKLNMGNMLSDPPETIYEKRKKNIDIEVVKKIVKGHYGRKEDRI